MGKILLVGCGGFFGAVARYGAGRLLHGALGFGFPWGTLAVNVAGCALIGGFLGRLDQASPVVQPWALLLVVGFLGSFTTFSAFGYETLTLLRASAWRLALANVLANVVLGLAAAALGMALARWLAR